MSEQFVRDVGIYAEVNEWSKEKSGYILIYLKEYPKAISAKDKKKEVSTSYQRLKSRKMRNICLVKV